MIELDCSTCSDDQKEILGCVNPAQLAVWEDDEDQFFTCPRKFITQDIIDFYDTFSIYKEIPGCSPKFDELSKKFVEGVKYYNQKYDLYYSEKIKTPKKVEDDLKVFRDGYNERHKSKGSISG